MLAPVFTRVLVGWDGSAGATVGLQLGCRLTAFPGGALTAVAVVPSFAHVEDATEREQAIAGVRAPLRAAYESAIAGADLNVEQYVSLEFVEEVDVARALDRYAATHPIGLVIVGLHGQEGLLHPRMGHIANRAVRIGRCPVLVVPEPGRSAAYPADDESARAKGLGLFHPFRHRDQAIG